MEIFAEKLRDRIEELGLTHAEVARRSGLAIRRFHHYVVGDREPDLQTLVKIAKVLDTTPDSLLGLTALPKVADGEADRLRAKLTATAQLMEAPALRLVTTLVDGVVDFMRGGGVWDVKSSQGGSQPPRSKRR